MDDPEATQLMLETLFDIKATSARSTSQLSSLRTTMKKRKKTPEERAADLERSRDLDRRLLEMIERYKDLNARRRAADA